MFDYLIVGAGVIGCMTARELSRYEASCLVLEAQNDVGNGTSSANSAIVHSGYDPVPGTLKARMNREGNALFDQVAKELDVPFSRIGSITVALDESQLETLKELQKRATLNGVETILLNQQELQEMEPCVSKECVGGLLAPTAGIIDPFELCVHAMENAIDNGVELHLSEPVTSIQKKDGYFLVNGTYEVRNIINCAGLYSCKINELVNPDDHRVEIIPRKGEYLVLDHFDMPFVKHTLFMVPSEKGKGVLVSPTTSGNYLVGPSAEVTTPDDNATDKPTIQDIRRQANLMVASIPYRETIRVFAGVRATPSTHDFTIEESVTPHFYNCIGIESPGLASSPAIAKMMVEIIKKHNDLKEKSTFNPCVRPYVRTRFLSDEERAQLFKKNAKFGKMICKCERITEGEILDALSRSCPPHSVKGVKRRLRAGFGRCQGGMCQAEVVRLLAKHYGVDPMEIPYDDVGSYLLLEHTKGEI